MHAGRASALHHVVAYVLLVALATLSVVIARTTHLPGWDVVFSLTIALAKAGIVLWVFMHLSEQPIQTRLALIVAALLVLTLVLLSAADVATRHTLPPAPRPSPGQTFYQR
jgi:cytochrome c oxidase subunit 4